MQKNYERYFRIINNYKRYNRKNNFGQINAGWKTTNSDFK